MKNYSQLLKQLPSSTVIISVGSFNPPTAKHELQFKLVEKLVEKHSAEHVVFVTESEDLPQDKKLHFLEMLFTNMNFASISEEVIKETVQGFKSKYRNVIVVASEDRIPGLKKTLKESAHIISAGDIENPRMKAIVTKGDYTSFKYQMPNSMRDIDARRLMNEMRQSMGLELIKEEVRFSIDALREKYFKGEIYHIGDIVESAGQTYEIMDRGSNYLVVVNSTGDLSRKWVKDVSLVEEVKKPTGPLKKACWKGYTAVGLKMKNGRKVPNCVPESVLDPRDVHKDYTEKSKTLQDLSRNKDVDQKHVQQRRLDLDKEYSKHKLKEDTDTQVSYKGYTSKNMHHCSSLANTFKLSLADAKDPVAMLNAIKTTDAYMDLHNERGDNPSLEQIKNWKYAHIKAKEDLQKIGHFDAHQDQWIKDKEQLNKLLAPHGIKEDIDFAKYSTFNIEKSYKTYRDFMKANKVQPGFVKDTRIDQNPIDPNVSQQIDDLEPFWPRHPHTKVGSTLANRDHHRRQKVAYHLESVETHTHEVHVKDHSIEDKHADFPKAHVDAGVHKHSGKYSGSTDKGHVFAFKSKEHADKFVKHVNTHKHTHAQHLDYMNEEYIDEDAKSLKAQADKHTEHAVAANRAGDDEKVKYHQAQVAKIKAKLSKLSEEQINEISQKVAGSYLDKVTKQQVSKQGIQPNMYEKLPKNRQKGVSNAFKRLEVDKEGKPVHHLVSKEDYIKGDLMDEDFASKFTESWSDTGKTGKHDASGEDSKEQHKVDKDGKPTGQRRWMTKSGKVIDEANGGEIGDGAGDDKIKKVKTLPPKLMPKDDSKRLGGGTKDHTFSAFYEKNMKKTKEDFEIGAQELMNYRIKKENK